MSRSHRALALALALALPLRDAFFYVFMNLFTQSVSISSNAIAAMWMGVVPIRALVLTLPQTLMPMLCVNGTLQLKESLAEKYLCMCTQTGAVP